MRPILLAAALAALAAGCHPSQVTASYEAPGTKLVRLDLDPVSSYLIDPNTESCSLLYSRYGSDAMTSIPVDCAKLAVKVPAAAAHITWVTPPSAPVEPPPVPEAAPAAPTPPSS